MGMCCWYTDGTQILYILCRHLFTIYSKITKKKRGREGGRRGGRGEKKSTELLLQSLTLSMVLLIFDAVHGIYKIKMASSKRWHIQIRSLRFTEELLTDMWELDL